MANFHAKNVLCKVQSEISLKSALFGDILNVLSGDMESVLRLFTNLVQGNRFLCVSPLLPMHPSYVLAYSKNYCCYRVYSGIFLRQAQLPQLQ